ncbi:hypothetical protein Clacol_010624 [Clathrus columnatus]|uniref:aldehyde dehydrogenase (NAD(+)) n=1 Tax=Clathrus columnatus TaxID=1419009 RepID=A0AAV5AVH7_9AGAM|nr:hypothetical protein Clacol_010624 [Clathrus columnatus]
MSSTFTHSFQTDLFTGKVNFPTGVFINGEWRAGATKLLLTTGQLLTAISEGTAKDVDLAVEAAQKAFDTVWGLNTPGSERGRILGKWANLIEEHLDELAAIESLNNDKNHGKVLETSEAVLGYTRHEPIGVVGQIIPWNFPLLMFAWKVGPALATGNTIVMKPSELTPLTALRVTQLGVEAGIPPGVLNIVTGYGKTVGHAISSHPSIEKVAFTGSTLVGREIMVQAAKSNLKNVTLELGGKSPNIIFEDADLNIAVEWATIGIFFNHGQTCCAGSRIYVQESIYEKFEQKFLERIKQIKLGDPLREGVNQGPQRIMSYIDDGKKSGAKAIIGGKRHGTEGYFIEPTIFTDTTNDMRIVREEIFGPVGVLVKFKDEEDIIKVANDTVYGLAAAVFSQNISRALSVGHRLKAGTVWVNCCNQLFAQIPFGGFKQSGIGRELGEYAIANYTAVKSVITNALTDGFEEISKVCTFGVQVVL